MPKNSKYDEIVQKLSLLRMSLYAIRERLIDDLDEMDAHIEALIPDRNKSRHRSHAEIKRRSQEIIEKKFPKKSSKTKGTKSS